MTWFSDQDLRRLAGATSYERGRDYVDAVGTVDELPDGVVATVEGTESYVVRLTDSAGLHGECSCPYGRDGNFCKHCVAVGLSLLGARPVAPRRQAARQGLRGYLHALGPDTLVDLVIELAEDDPALLRRLSLRAATHGETDVKELRRLVGGLRQRGFLPYGRGLDYARKASDVLDALDRAGESAPARIGPLYRTAIQHLTRTTEQADDSSGSIGDQIGRAVAGYARACRAAPPRDPAELAAWLIDFRVQGPGWPELPIADFAEALGESGLAAYRARLAELAGRHLDPGDRWTVRHLLEQYLKVIARDTDALVAMYAEELPQSYQYVRIGETLRDAGRQAEAITWLRRGLTEANRPDSRIDSLLAELLTGQGEYAEAVGIRWRLFTELPDPQRHQDLLDAAERAATLAEVAERAAAHLHQRAASGGYQADFLVRVLLESGDADGAWEAAVRYRCSAGILYRVGEVRARTHPADAIPVLARQAEDKMTTGTKGYPAAARIVTQIRDLHERAGLDFEAFLAALRERHRRKPSFLAALDKAGL
ncbi:SWIM zinc finger family protein [Actinoplanes siamensis]|uniref:SWIM-type domain-containing protein n=1 Tax=Actinoplanes siamensis TaxID=1223317 RepID=A0A919TLQ6_9ACTN|nr:DUF6880 family protein [Actinoplanes siamensis]GIF06862.1 hypothetical protein Asi03nite_44000 [Actinoplanes siamensis]